MKTYNEAVQYAEKLREDTNIMLDERTGEYHVIRQFAIEHWKQHYTNVAEVRVQMVVTRLVQEKTYSVWRGGQGGDYESLPASELTDEERKDHRVGA